MVIRDILNLAGPPRPMPLLVRLRVLFGGFMSQFGWFFFGFGLVFVWAFTLRADLTSWYVFRGRLENTEGIIITSRKTNMSVGGSEHSDGTPVYEHDYSFVRPDGIEYKGISYQTGGGLREGQKVTVEFPEGNCEVSRVKGMRRAHVGLFGLMPVIFPAIGLCFIVAGFRKGIKANRLLAMGKQATGRLKSKVKTNTKINKQPVYKLTFEFKTPDGIEHEVTAKTHQPEKLEDDAEEPLLYDPMFPSYAVMLDNLPGSPRIDEGGNIRAGSAFAACLQLIIPVATVIGHSGYIYLRFLS